jgi:hypothetical protein
VAAKSDRDPYPEPHGMRIGLAFWIRIRIRIRVEVKAGSITLPSTGNANRVPVSTISTQFIYGLKIRPFRISYFLVVLGDLDL